MEFKRLVVVAGLILAVPAIAQEGSEDSAPAAEATAEQQKLIDNCSNHKFETVITVDPVKKRGSRVKLCSVPGASDADWIKTLKDAIRQVDSQSGMPVSARQELVAQLKAEVAKYEKGNEKPTTLGATITPMRDQALVDPTERFEVSTLPPLDPPKKSPVASGAASSARAVPARPMRIDVKCLSPGQRGIGGTCALLERDTLLSVRAVEGLEQGGTLKFRRRGDDRGSFELSPMQAGQVARVRLPGELCRGVKSTKVEIELLARGATTVSHRAGPFGLRC